MYVRGIYIRNYRSIKSADIDNCAYLNVFIGKNNAGKSNVLSGVEAFFHHLHTGEAASIWRNVRRPTDEFTLRDSSVPIQIGIEFRLDPADFTELKEQLKTGAPGLEAAVDQIPPSEILSIIVSAVPDGAEIVGFVEQIDLSPIHAGERLDTPSSRLFRASADAAKELTQKAKRSATTRSELESLDRLVQEYPREVLRDRESFRFPGISNAPTLRRHLEELRKAPPDQTESIIARIRADYERLLEGWAQEDIKTPVKSFSGQVYAIPDYVSWIIDRIGKTKLLHFKETRQAIGAVEADQLLKLKTKRRGPERLAALQSIVRQLLGVSIDAFEPEAAAPSRTRREVAAEMDIDDFLVDANGAGIREALRIILDIELTSPSLILLEEPEVHLHPGLETVIHRYLAQTSRTAQVFVATHSTSFIDTSLAQNIFVVGRSGGLSTVRKLVSEDDVLSIPEEIGLRPSSVLMFDRLIFVEGPIDEAIIREFAQKRNIDFARLNISFVQMGGATTFAHYAADKTLSMLSRRQIAMFFVVDRDEREDAEIKRMIDRLGGRATLLTHSRREIENYLLDSESILALLVEKQKLGKATIAIPTAQEISQRIDVAADSLKDRVIDLRIGKIMLRPVYPDRLEGSKLDQLKSSVAELRQRMANYDDVEKTVRSEVENSWAAKKLELAPGSEILAHVFGHFGVGYKKEVDGRRLAELILPDKVAGDIVELLKTVSKE